MWDISQTLQKCVIIAIYPNSERMMKLICTFFGHKYVPQSVELALRSLLVNLIEKEGVDLFYVGNHGAFDAMVRRVLRDLSKRYAITFHVVLAYMPQKSDPLDPMDYSDTILPEGVETVPKRFAISFRNRWMVERADVVITYVTHEIGSGAAQFKKLAERKKKRVINLCDHHIQ